MQDRYKFKIWDKTEKKFLPLDSKTENTDSWISIDNTGVYLVERDNARDVAFFTDITEDVIILQCTGLKDKNGKLIYESDIIVIPNQYPFYDYKNKEDMKQDLNSTEGEIKGESVLNYIGIVEWIYSQWQYVYHCVNPNKRGISEGINQGLNDFGFDETENTCYEVIGNIYENPELLEVGILA